jgi:urease accessory protein
MLDGAHLPTLQRSRGRASASFAQVRGAVRLVDLYQSGSAKILLPRTAGDVPEAVFLNTSGGLTDGDTLSLALHIGQGARVLATTQTSERAYAARRDAAHVSVTATVLAGGRLDWMPQETILYQSSNLSRRTEVDLAPGAECLLAETIILGRHAMGEVVTDAHLRDHRMVRRNGSPVWAETLHLTPEVLTSPSPALLGGARALAVVCLVAQGAEDAVAPLRAALTHPGTTGAVSGWNGKCVVRVVATDGWPLRQQLAQILHILSGRSLPRVWQMAPPIQSIGDRP